MKIWIALTAGFYAIMRGFGEAMTMFQPGVREHPMFAWYHITRIVEAVALSVAILLMYSLKDVKGIVYYFMGTVLIVWELTELSYFFGRLGQAPFGHENLMGVYSVDSINGIIILHVSRVMFGVGLYIFAQKRACLNDV